MFRYVVDMNVNNERTSIQGSVIVDAANFNTAAKAAPKAFSSPLRKKVTIVSVRCLGETPAEETVEAPSVGGSSEANTDENQVA